jgi:pimeloyl-ACP methyl ester carboxylesterase
MPAERGTLLLLPGLLCDATVWLAQQSALQPHAYCVVADYGNSASLADMAERALSQAPGGPLCVAGHSMGGRVALEIVRHWPGRVQKLALLDTGFEARAAGEAGERERAGRMELLALAQAGGMRAMGQRWARGMVHPAQLDTPLFETILRMIERSSPAIFAAQIQALICRPDATELLRCMQLPVLLVCGRQDSWSPLARHEQMRDLLLAQPSPAPVELVAIEDCVHMSTLEQADQVSRALLAWLQPVWPQPWAPQTSLPSAGKD